MILTKYQIFNDYIEGKLKEIGIFVSKKDFDKIEIEKKYQEACSGDFDVKEMIFTDSFSKGYRRPSNFSAISSIKSVVE